MITLHVNILAAYQYYFMPSWQARGQEYRISSLILDDNFGAVIEERKLRTILFA